jgi:pimeloyl-ACP methyl ester carboxylesterase
MLTLARWLGPWADSTKSPDVVTLDDDSEPVRVRVYQRAHGQPFKRRFVIAPGLHYAGPDDPRMDRFCRILAAAGHQVIAPFVPSYLALVPDEQAKRDFIGVVESLGQRDDNHGKPVVFSISFGSLLAFALAAERPELVDRLVIFGGYADFHETMKFCLTGEVAGGRQATRDPLNQCVVLMNLLEQIAHDREQTDALAFWWRAYVQRTWGRPELKERERFVEIAEQLAPEVPDSVRDLFLIGVGARDGAWDLALPALGEFDASALDPAPYLPRVRCRVDLVHGMDDDVIPYEQSHVLATRLVNASQVRAHITGLYGHTGSQRPPLGAVAKELATMVRLLRVMAG